MKFRSIRIVLCCLLVMASVASVWAADPPSYTRKEDVIYGRKFGTALTMDVFTPKAESNGAGIVFAVSGGWRSAHEAIDSPFFKPFIPELLRHAHTVFAVVHPRHPKLTIP